MKKILIPIDYYLPGYRAGGPTRSIANLVHILKQKCIVYIISRNYDFLMEHSPYELEAETWLKMEENVYVMYVSSGWYNQFKVIREIISKENFSTIYLSSFFSPLFSIVPFFKYITHSPRMIHLVMAPSGEFAPKALANKTYKKRPYIKLVQALSLLTITKKKTPWIWHSTSDHETQRIQHFFSHANVIQIPNLPTQQAPVFLEKPKESGSIRFVTTSRIASIKNIHFFIERLLNVKFDVTFDIYGMEESQKYIEGCEALIAQLPSNVRCRILPSVPHKEIHRLIQEYHVYVSPTFGENFGHAIFESFLAGRPVLISNTTPWLHLKKKNVGWDVALEQPEQWDQSIREAAELTDDAFRQMCTQSYAYAADFLKEDSYRQKYYQLLNV